MKKHWISELKGSRIISRKEMKRLTGGAFTPFKVYECRVSPSGFTAGFVCLGNFSARPSTECFNCRGVSYALFDSYVKECPYNCFG